MSPDGTSPPPRDTRLPDVDAPSCEDAARLTAGDDAPAQINYGAYARAIVTARARIGRYLDPSLFADPAFDILLDLLASEEEGRKVNMSSCACAGRVPRTTGLRWICTLEQKGLLERIDDEADQRTTFVRLTPDARASLIDYLGSIARVPTLSPKAKADDVEGSSTAEPD